MTDAPERLNLRKCLGGGWSSFDDDHGTEYIRADLHDTAIAELVEGLRLTAVTAVLLGATEMELDEARALIAKYSAQTSPAPV